MMYKSILDAIGNTPLVRVNLDTPATVYAKLEYLNPGGSVKDRSARYMIEQAERTGQLPPGGTIIEASSGNQGISAAMIGAAKGYHVIITVSEKISREKLAAIRAYGAQVIVCPVAPRVDDPNSYQTIAKNILAQTPNAFMLDQYFNERNRDAHYHSLGPEVWQQTHGTVTHFFAGAGTGGTASGAGRYLKEQNKNIQVLAIDAAHSYRSTGGNPKPYTIDGIGIDMDSPVIDYAAIDEIITVTDDDAFCALKKLARQGLLGGPTSGAVLWGVSNYSKRLAASDIVVMIFGDSGRAYLSKDLF